MERNKDLEMMQEVAFKIIATIGEAKTKYILALKAIKKERDFESANKLIEEAKELANKAHTYHFELIQQEAKGNQLPFSLMLMHAEDQLLTTETIKVLVEELIDIYKII